QIYNEQINKGLNHFMGEFFNSFRELSNNPESLATRTLVKESADFLTKDFNRVDKQMKNIQRDVDFQIATHVEEINQITKEIADLNEKVQRVTIEGGPANDERDRRDELVKQLSEKVNINYAEGDSGLLTITAGNSAVLVSGYSHRDLFVSPTGEKGDKGEGNFDIFYKATEEGTPVNVTTQLNGGKLGGLLEVRDKSINEILHRVDNMAYTLAKEVNKAHVQGFDRYNKQGQGFFENVQEAKGAAGKIRLNMNLKTDVGLIATAATQNAPGDNRIANIISNIQYKNSMENGASTLDDYYNSTVGKLGIMAKRANNDLVSQEGIQKQLSNIRESISGVNLDEETSKMIEYQKSFDASARLIRTADEMLDTVLNLKRL
ncbi:MAG: flagellar hook-associated protein FlgK, partial [Bdellovibrionales bacterium]|nr:flagellar hook-associated protein FlgK [Bdellovibrionales bacterium]